MYTLAHTATSNCPIRTSNTQRLYKFIIIILQIPSFDGSHRYARPTPRWQEGKNETSRCQRELELEGDTLPYEIYVTHSDG